MVSVISPVYNCAPYIRACIDSLRAQTWHDFEVLFVDDHGQDDSMALARAYTEGDPRFRFLATPANSGPGVARNVGIEAARGEYIAFIDADDQVCPTFLHQLLEATVRVGETSGHNIDLSYCQLQYRGGSRDGQVHRNPVVNSTDFSVGEKQYFLRRFVTFSVCFLFRRAFLLDNELRFPARRNSEDTNFLTRCLLLSGSIACTDEPLYYYCVRDNSLTTGRNRRKYRERLDAVNALMRDYQALCRNPRYRSLQLSRLRPVMALLWLKKGLAQALKELIKL